MRLVPRLIDIASCARCEYYFSQPTSRTIQVPPDFPIDVVYTWVDGSDPGHAAKRIRLFPPAGQEHSVGVPLFRDNGELLYSPRSLAKYAPWTRRIHLVTDKQRPDWLREHPDIAIVDHGDIIPRQYLPTFNSHIVEAYLHRIPGLAENYIYFNDDFFLTAPAKPGDFSRPTVCRIFFLTGARDDVKDTSGWKPRTPIPGSTRARNWNGAELRPRRKSLPRTDLAR